jgi:hypothetical protein
MWSLINMEETTMMKFDARQSEAQRKAIKEETQAQFDARQSETRWRAMEEETQAKFDAKMLIQQRQEATNRRLSNESTQCEVRIKMESPTYSVSIKKEPPMN